MDINPRRDLGIKGISEQPDTSPDSKVVTDWLKETDAARKLEKNFRKEGNRINAIYEGAQKEEMQFNILYSNTETMLPALYNSTPRPVVSRRFKDEDPLGKMASLATQRTLEYLIDNGDAEYTPFDDLMKSATLEALLPGRGITRFKYEAEMEEAANEKAAEAAESPEDEAVEPGESASEVEAPEETVASETVVGEEVPWDRFLHGPAKKWKDVPWIAFEHFMTREELERNFGEIGAKVPVIEMVHSDADDDTENRTQVKDTQGVKVAPVLEIWDKEEERVLFISSQWKQGPLKEVPDPLGLSGFFPCPRPLSFIAKITTLTPVALYTMYEEQAKELNKITVRIGKLISALKVRGLYDSTVEGISKVLQADDNVLVPAENVAAMLANGNALEKAIWLMPIEKLVAVLQQLYLQRTQVKTVIYEITGIADIMRGSSQASETLGAQQIKNQWGTLRLKKTQKEVMRYCRDCLRIMAEIAVSKLSPDTLRGMTGLPYPTGMEKSQAQQQVQAIAQQSQQQQMMMAAQAQQMGQQPPPPQPPQIPPQLQQVMSMPSWDELLTLLKDDIQRSYRIDIETNSTVDAEATEDKQDISELLNAISQFVNGVAPMVADGSMPFDVVQGMLLAVVRRYRFGPELEDQLKKMQPPKPPADPAEAKKAAAEVQKQQEALKQQGEQMQQQAQQLQQQIKDQTNQLAMDKQQFEMEKKMAQKELAMQEQMAQKQLAMDKAMAAKELEMQASMNEQKLSMKSSLQGEVHKRAMEGVAQKEQQVGQAAAQTKDTGAHLKPLVDTLTSGLESIGKQLSDGLQAAAKTPRKAVKNPDGSWSTQ